MIAPRSFAVNGRSLSHSPLPPLGRLAELADGGFEVDLTDFSAKTYGRVLRTDGQIAQSFQSTARAGWPRFYLAVQKPTPNHVGRRLPDHPQSLQAGGRAGIFVPRAPSTASIRRLGGRVIAATGTERWRSSLSVGGSSIRTRLGSFMRRLVRSSARSATRIPASASRNPGTASGCRSSIEIAKSVSRFLSSGATYPRLSAVVPSYGVLTTFVRRDFGAPRRILGRSFLPMAYGGGWTIF